MSSVKLEALCIKIKYFRANCCSLNLEHIDLLEIPVYEDTGPRISSRTENNSLKAHPS